MLVTRGVRSPRRRASSGRDGLKLRLQTDHDAARRDRLVARRRASRELDVSRPFDIAYRLERDEYQGVSRLQAKLADFRT